MSVRTISRTAGVAIGVVLLALLGITFAIARDGQESPRGGNPKCNGLDADIVGTDGDDQGADQISGTPDDDVIVSMDGADVIAGGEGDDTICAKPGDDRASGGAGDDHVRGGKGNDTIFGGTGSDDLRGGKGDDEVFGEKGPDEIRGGKGNDECAGGPGRDTIQTCEEDVDPPENHPPSAVDDENVTSEDTQITTHPLANDSDPDGDGLAVDDLDTSGTDGSVTITEDGVQYDPNGQFESLGDQENETDTFGYTAGDGRGGSDDATVTVTIVGQDDPPTASADAKTVAQDSDPEQINVLANDTDIDGGPKSVESITQPANGTVAITGGGSALTYEPDAGYCNDPGAEPTDGFDYTLNGGSQATVAVTVNCDVLPVAVDDSATVDEDDLPQQIDVLSNDTNPDGGLLAVESVTQPANGSVQFTGDGSDLTYEPEPDYCNDPGAAPTDDFDYTLNGGSSATVAVTVNCFDDTPIATDDEVAVGEDSGPNTIDVLLNDDDPDGNFQIQGVTQPANGTVVVAGDGQDLTYEPDPEYCNNNDLDPPDSFIYSLTPGSSGATVSVTVNCDADPPTLDLDNTTPGNNSTATFTEGGAPADLAPNADVADVDSTDLDSATITVTDAPDGPDEVLTVDTTGTSITATATSSPDQLTRFLTLSGTDTKANYQQVLRTAEYENTDQDPDSTSRSVTFTVNDGDADSNSPTSTVTVGIDNDAPLLDLNGPPGGFDESAAFTEGGAAADLAPNSNVADNDDANVESADLELTNSQDGAAETISVNLTGTPITLDGASTNHHLILTGTATKAEYQQVLRTAEYDNTDQDPDSTARSITFTVNDGDVDSATATSVVTVTPVNDPPTLALYFTDFNSLAHFTEGSGPVDLAPNSNVADPDDLNIESADIELTDPQDGAAESISVDLTGTAITLDGASTNQHLILTGTATKAEYQQVFRTAEYDNTDQDPQTSLGRNVDFVMNDGDDDSNKPSTFVLVSAANDAPTLDLNGAGAGVDETAAFTEGGSAAMLAPNAVPGDPDDTNLNSARVTLTNRPDGDSAESLSANLSGTGLSGIYTNATGVLELTGDRPLSDYQQALRTVTYQNTDQDPDNTNRIVNFKVNDGSADSGTPKTTVTITAVNDSPIVDMNGASLFGIDSTVAFTEDSSPANPGSGAVALGPAATATDVDNGTLASATLTLTNHPDGGAESLGVTIPGGNPITVSNNNSHVLTLNGPATKVQFEAAIRAVKYNNTSNTPTTTDRDVTTVVNDGSDNSAAAHTTVTVTATNDAPVADDETFSGADSAVGNTTLVVNDPTDGAPSQSDPKKSITGDILDGDSDDGPASSLTVGPTGAQAITTQDGGKVTLEADGDFTFFPKAGTSCSENDQFDYTLSDNDGTDPETDTGTVSLTMTECVWYANNALGSNGTGTSSSPFNTLAVSSGVGLAGVGGAGDSDDADDYLFLFQGSGAYAGGLPLENNQRLFSQRHGLTVGSDTLFPASGSNATITTASDNAVRLANSNTIQGIDLGLAPAASLSGSFTTGTATVNTATSGSINNPAGAAVDVSATDVNMAFVDLDSSGAVGDGIHLEDVSGAFTAGSGSLIQNAGGQDVEISGNGIGDTVNLTYDGAISDSTGVAVLISGQSGGTKDFNGPIGTAANPAGAISLTNNAGATIRFDGGTILSTGAANAFSATGLGTVVVTDPNALGTEPDNTLATSTGTALNVAGTIIGSGGLNFKSISSSGAPSGIVLNNTGSSFGSLTVTGNGSSGSGGTIENSTSDGVALTRTPSPSLSFMNITDVTGGFNDNGISMADVTGSVILANDTISGAPRNGIELDNNDTDLTGFTMTNSTVTCPPGADCVSTGSVGNDGLRLTMRGSSALTSGSVTGSSFSGIRSVALQVHASLTGRIGSSTGETINNSMLVQNNTFTGNGRGIDIASADTSSVAFQVLSNNIVGKLTAPGAIPSQASGDAIGVFTDAGGGPASHSFVGKIDGNTIGTPGVKDSGSGFGNGISAEIQGQTTQGIVTVSNNAIREVPNDSILSFIGQNGAAASGTNSARFKIANNTMPAPSGSNLSLCGPANSPCATNGIFVLADQGTPVCNVISGNSIYDVTTMNGSFDVYLAERIGPPAGAQLTVEGTGPVTTSVNNTNTLSGANKTHDENGNVTTVGAGACGAFP